MAGLLQELSDPVAVGAAQARGSAGDDFSAMQRRQPTPQIAACQPRDRREIIARINFGLSRADSQWIAELLQQASHRDGWHWPIVGQLWLTDQVPTGGCLVRYCDPRTGRNRGPWCVLYVTASFAARLPPEGSA